VFLVHKGSRQRKGTSPAVLQLDPKETYIIEVEKKGYRLWSSPVNFEGDGPVRLVAVLQQEKAERSRRPAVRPRVHHRPRSHRPRREPPPAPKPVPPPRPEPPPQPRGTGTLLINSNPWTRITIDGRDTGLTTPQRSIPLPAGRHTITLRNPKFRINISFSVTIQPNKRTKVIKKNLLQQ
jgi:hypothetical protein